MFLSVIIPVLNEALTIPLILGRLREILHELTWEVIFVNDGSTDATGSILDRAALEDPRVRVLSFSRNFGHQAAVTAGLDFANGDAIVVMDADLEDPPELLPQMLALFEQGYDVVSHRRISRESRFKRWTRALFCRALAWMADQRITPDIGNFRLFSRRAALALRSLREQRHCMHGMVAWLGLREAIIPFERKARIAGHANYSLLKMMRLAWTGMSSFSTFPLRISIAAGGVISGAGFLYLLRLIYLARWTRAVVPVWSSAVALECVFSGLILLALGAIGSYLARTYEEAKDRPLYVVSETCNIAMPQRSLQRAVVLRDPFSTLPFAANDAEGSRFEEGVLSPRSTANIEQIHIYR